jgi:hypothetical protein
MAMMRAKMKVSKIEMFEGCEVLTMNAVCKPTGYPADGSDEDNTFAMFTPTAELKMSVNNPALHGQFKPGQKFYLDFTSAD